MPRSRGLGAQPPEATAFKLLFRVWSMKLGAKIHDRYFGKIILFSDTKLDACALCSERGSGGAARAFEPLFRPWSMKFDMYA